MAIYKCEICGYIHDESKEKTPFKDLSQCPVCGVDICFFEQIGEGSKQSDEKYVKPGGKINELDYDAKFVRNDATERHMGAIHQMAVSGESIIEAMSIRDVKPTWDSIYILGNQLNPGPLDENADVSTRTIIGRNAKKPMVIDMPIFITHMSFGALSKEVKISLARGSAMAKTAMCSGEGGILPEEKEASYKYIFEYVPNLYSVTDESLKNSDAIEIKIGQGTKPGMGGHLPAEKVTEEISKIRNKPMGQDIISPSSFPNLKTKEDLKDMVEMLRVRSDGRPIGIKIAAGKIERDLEFIAYAMPDFITIDGRGGATGASPKIIRDSTSVPTIYALHRARKYLEQHNLDIDLVITGGLRVSSDFAKAIAMGATAVAIGSAALIAAACQQYRICNIGNCPVGVATQDEELRKRLDVDKSAQRVANFLKVVDNELKTYARITGNQTVHGLSLEDLCTIDSEISKHTFIEHA